MRKFYIRNFLLTHTAIRNAVQSLAAEGNVTPHDFKKFVKVMHIHHAGEEKIFFKSIQIKTHDADKVITEMELEHEDFDNIVKKIHSDFKKPSNLKTYLSILSEMCLKHADIEDEIIVPIFCEHYGFFKQKFIEWKIGMHIKPWNLSLMIGFIYRNLNDSQKISFKQSLPFLIRFLAK